MNDKKFAAIYHISEGHVRRRRCAARKEKNIPVSRSVDLTSAPTLKKEK
jgi:hypothetical protein